MVHKKRHPLFGVEQTGHVFLEPDARLAGWLADQLDNGEDLVDCGAGVGALVARPELAHRVIGIDIMVPRPEDARAHVYLIDAVDFPFQKGKIPIFVRPCHDGFVMRTLRRALPIVGRAYYVSKPENVSTDLDEREVDVRGAGLFNWEGPSGERVYLITPVDATVTEMALVDGWWRRVDYRSDGRTVLENSRGGWIPSRNAGAITRSLLLMADEADAWDVVERPRWWKLTAEYEDQQRTRETILAAVADGPWFEVKAEGKRVILKALEWFASGDWISERVVQAARGLDP